MKNECTALAVIASLLVAVTLQGCAVPLILGVKQVKYNQDGSSEYNFITGADFNIGLSGTDTLNNKKGIKPN